ncbi:MAG: hypothetical protein FJX68_17895 [Alphaproteobacteria bacterium]|nr:hypothetical protein [Alphaproteobacteria bacterium]
MQHRVAVVGTAAIPVGPHQRLEDVSELPLEHEILGRLAVEATKHAGIGKDDIDSLVCTHPREYTRQLYFSTFMANYLRLPCRAQVSEVIGNGMTGGLAFDRAMQDVEQGRARVALALGVNMETAVSAAEHMNRTMRATGDVDFHTPFGHLEEPHH